MNARQSTCWGIAVVSALPFLSALNLGCSATPIGFAVSMAGDAVNDVDEQQRAKQFVGGPVSAADAALNAPVEVYSDARSGHEWRVYSVPVDPLNTSRYVLEVSNAQVIALDKVQQMSDPVAYAATIAVLEPKVMGKSPADCEASLGMGPPLLTVRSKTTGQMIQLYDARLVKGLQGPHYCVLRFDASSRCQKVNVVKAYTSGGRDITQ